MKNALEEYTGIIGIGCLMSLGLIFITDSQAKYFSDIENVSKTSSWTMLMSIPILIINYIFGLIVVYLSEIVIAPLLPRRIYREYANLFLSISGKGEQLLQNKYINDFRDVRILFGCSLSVLFVGIGVYMESLTHKVYMDIAIIGLVGCILLAVICPMIAYRIMKVFIHNLSDKLLITPAILSK